jgi:hypothetical protein
MSELSQEMLKERRVAPFSKWEKELPKIVFDPRFKVCENYDLSFTCVNLPSSDFDC